MYCINRKISFRVLPGATACLAGTPTDRRRRARGQPDKTMMSDAALDVAPVSVWVQLLVGEEKQGQSFCIKPIPEDVNALKTAVIEKWGGHLAAAAGGVSGRPQSEGFHMLHH